MRPPEKGASRHSTESDFARSEAEILLGDFSALFQQLGIREKITDSDLSPAQTCKPIADIAALESFLEKYLTGILLPLELPAIAEACGHVRRGELRELIALDQKLAGEARLSPFAAASKKIGAHQLQRLKPLRDERTVQRYLNNVETGHAAGWHTLVYGLTLAVYSFPLRQGLIHYGRQTLSALARSAGGAHADEMLEKLLARLPEAVEQTLARS